ncbi:MAG: hypothetical protein WC819_06700 [Parcubacteria group bacterium]|jgi:hypothetical protein
MKRFSLIAIMMMVLGFCFTSTASATLSNDVIEKKLIQYVTNLFERNNVKNIIEKKINRENNCFAHTQKQGTHYVAAEVIVSLSDARFIVAVYLEMEEGMIVKIVDSKHHVYLDKKQNEKKYNDFQEESARFLTKAYNFGKANGVIAVVW